MPYTGGELPIQGSNQPEASPLFRVLQWRFMHPSQGREGNRGLTEWSPQKCRWGRLVAQDRTIPLHPPLVSIQDKPEAGSWAWSTPGCGQVRARKTGLLSGEAAPKPLTAHPPSHRGSATVEEMEERPRRQEESPGPARLLLWGQP